MTYLRKLTIALSIVFLVIAIMPAAQAQQRDHRTVIDVPYPVRVDQTVLEPGRYVIQLLRTTASGNTVQILDRDEKKVFATVLTATVERKKISEKTEFWFWRTPKGQPRVVRAWFYPGEITGVEVITKQTAKLH